MSEPTDRPESVADALESFVRAGLVFGRKEGAGVGSHLFIFGPIDPDPCGVLTFHDGHDWQVTMSRPGVSRDRVYGPALELARRLYPEG